MHARYLDNDNGTKLCFVSYLWQARKQCIHLHVAYYINIRAAYYDELDLRVEK